MVCMFTIQSFYVILYLFSLLFLLPLPLFVSFSSFSFSSFLCSSFSFSSSFSFFLLLLLLFFHPLLLLLFFLLLFFLFLSLLLLLLLLVFFLIFLLFSCIQGFFQCMLLPGVPAGYGLYVHHIVFQQCRSVVILLEDIFCHHTATAWLLLTNGHSSVVLHVVSCHTLSGADSSEFRFRSGRIWLLWNRKNGKISEYIIISIDGTE